jgi:hypothetical protein
VAGHLPCRVVLSGVRLHAVLHRNLRMSNNTLALLIGGLLPAVCFGLTGRSKR